MSVAAIVAGVIGLGGLAMTAKGQSDMKKANKKKLAQDAENFDEQQAENLRRYTLSRGVDTANGNRAVNTFLPLWATVRKNETSLPGSAGRTPGSTSLPGSAGRTPGSDYS